MLFRQKWCMQALPNPRLLYTLIYIHFEIHNTFQCQHWFFGQSFKYIMFYIWIAKTINPTIKLTYSHQKFTQSMLQIGEK